MNIVLCIPDPQDGAEQWIEAFSHSLPDAKLHLWKEGTPGMDADYAVVRKPSASFFATHPRLKAVFNLGAGVDSLLKLGTLPPALPLVKLDDAGMARQMIDYVGWAVLRHFRQFDRYEEQRRRHCWQPLEAPRHADFPIGIMGLGVLGRVVGRELVRLGFEVHGWSRHRKTMEGIVSHASDAELPGFLARTRILVCMLPLTHATDGILNRDTLGRLIPGSYLINVARGAHLVEEDLLALLDSGHVAGATLDVFRQEPLPPEHPFWREPKITLTPHVSAVVLRNETIAQVSEKLLALARGEAISGMIDRSLEY